MLVAEGKTNKEIAADVFLSDKTVKNYVSSILSKLDLERRAQAAAFIAKHRRRHLRRRLVTIGPPQRGHSAVADRRGAARNLTDGQRAPTRGELGRDAGRQEVRRC